MPLEVIRSLAASIMCSTVPMIYLQGYGDSIIPGSASCTLTVGALARMDSCLNRGSEADAVRSTAGGEKSLEDYTFSGSGQSGEASLAEQAAQSAAASTFEVPLHALCCDTLGAANCNVLLFCCVMCCCE